LRPCSGKITGLVIEYDILGDITWDLLALKFPGGNNRAGLPSSGVRETNVYLWLRDLLPVLTPRLITASKSGKWLLMEAIPTGLQPASYQKSDLQLVIERAVALHERFWQFRSFTRALLAVRRRPKNLQLVESSAPARIQYLPASGTQCSPRDNPKAV